MCIRDSTHTHTHTHTLLTLVQLNLQGLRNLSIDQSLLNGSTKAVVSYLKSRLTRSVPYYHMKMMMVGAADKGKTTLLRQILQEKAPASLKSNVATMGVTVKQWSYLQRQSSGHNDRYHLSCWDFAGQEEFYTTHQCFLSQRSLYVVSVHPCITTSSTRSYMFNHLCGKCASMCYY